MNELRWEPYVLINNNNVRSFWRSHFGNGAQRKLLFVLGKGFDIRMNVALKSISETCPELPIQSMLIEFDEGIGSSSLQYDWIVQENLKEFTSINSQTSPIFKNIKLLTDRRRRRRIGGRNASAIFKSFSDIQIFSDIIVDISALPKGVYFSLIGKLLKLIDTSSVNRPPNLFIVVAENAEIDSTIQETEVDDDLTYLHGFGGGIELTSENEKPLVWYPILGEDKSIHLRKAFDKITEDKNRLFEICPTLPFPSHDPRRSDSLLMEYHGILFDEFDIEPQNIMYVAEKNPFEAYIQLVKSIRNYNSSLDVIDGCKVALSTFSSKLLSIASLLVAYEYNHDVGVLNVDTRGYLLTNSMEELQKMNTKSELYVSWIAGEAYSNT